jgi:hypothetical protein
MAVHTATAARTTVVILGLSLGLVACGTQRSNDRAVPLSTPKTEAAAAAAVAAVQGTLKENKAIVTPKTQRAAAVHFLTPEAAMRYLATAYNRHDHAAVKHVTTASARSFLEDMRPIAPRIHFQSCDRDMDNTYLCRFTHDRPKGGAMHDHGEATVLVAPATKPGWYMTELTECS